MDYSNSLRDPSISKTLVELIWRLAQRPVRLMEVCGTHTVAILRHGIRSLMPETVELVSGPGCPVCVTAQRDIDLAVEMCKVPGITIVTFGDMVRVPGTRGSLKDEMAKGSDVRVVYSSMDAIPMAQKEPNRVFIFLGVGFETTAPTIAATIKATKDLGINNLKFLSLHKLLPPALHALLKGEEVRIHGLICPGHVSTIIGSRPYLPFAREMGIPCVITGFEPVDILQGIYLILRQISEGRHEVEIQYQRIVSPEGNPKALKIMEEVFEPCDSEWRGLGWIRESGLRLKQIYGQMDALNTIHVDVKDSFEPKGCKCGDVLKGIIKPNMCKMFGTLCTPDEPLGPCMVSSEGSCAAYFNYNM